MVLKVKSEKELESFVRMVINRRNEEVRRKESSRKKSVQYKRRFERFVRRLGTGYEPMRVGVGEGHQVVVCGVFDDNGYVEVSC